MAIRVNNLTDKTVTLEGHVNDTLEPYEVKVYEDVDIADVEGDSVYTTGEVLLEDMDEVRAIRERFAVPGIPAGV